MSNKLTEKKAENKILEVCKEISTKDETISFLGWKDGSYVSNMSYLILHNSKFDVTWDSTTYNNFIRLRHKGKHSLKPRIVRSDENNLRRYTTEQFIKLIQKRFPNKNFVEIDYYLEYKKRKNIYRVQWRTTLFFQTSFI